MLPDLSCPIHTARGTGLRATSIYLLGSGIKGSLHLTVETIQALKACKRVFVLHADQGVLDAVREYCPEVTDVAALYEGKAIRHEVYREISVQLVEAARESAPVAFLVHGHPLFLVSATEYTLELAEQHDLRVSVLPAVSSFDTLLCDLRIDYGYGVQIFDTTTLLKGGWQPNPEVPLLLFQLTSTLNDRVITGEPSEQILGPLVELLAPLYGPDHEVQVVWSSAHALEPSSITATTIGQLTSAQLELWRRPTLYVPAKQ